MNNVAFLLKKGNNPITTKTRKMNTTETKTEALSPKDYRIINGGERNIIDTMWGQYFLLFNGGGGYCGTGYSDYLVYQFDMNKGLLLVGNASVSYCQHKNYNLSSLNIHGIDIAIPMPIDNLMVRITKTTN